MNTVTLRALPAARDHGTIVPATKAATIVVPDDAALAPFTEPPPEAPSRNRPGAWHLTILGLVPFSTASRWRTYLTKYAEWQARKSIHEEARGRALATRQLIDAHQHHERLVLQDQQQWELAEAAERLRVAEAIKRRRAARALREQRWRAAVSSRNSQAGHVPVGIEHLHEDLRSLRAEIVATRTVVKEANKPSQSDSNSHPHDRTDRPLDSRLEGLQRHLQEQFERVTSYLVLIALILAVHVWRHW